MVSCADALCTALLCSHLPQKTNCESGVKQASSGMPLLFWKPCKHHSPHQLVETFSCQLLSWCNPFPVNCSVDVTLFLLIAQLM